MGWWTGHILYYSILHPKHCLVALSGAVTPQCAKFRYSHLPPTKVLSNVLGIKVENGFQTRNVSTKTLEHITSRSILRFFFKVSCIFVSTRVTFCT
jgi:hypothetical protein